MLTTTVNASKNDYGLAHWDLLLTRNIMAYLQITIPASRDNADQISDALEEVEALAITLEDAQDNAIFQLQPQEMPLWELIKVKALFPETTATDIIITQLTQLLNPDHPLNYHSEIIAEQDWVRLTQQHFKPQCYANHLWICPSWHTESLEGAIVHIDPGLAFGTGTHPTTSLCLDWLAHHAPTNKTVIDYGCGSGILSLAAAKLGATHVYAVDHDEQALLATTNNARLNANITTDQLMVCYPEQLPTMKADIVLANILSGPLISLEPTLRQLIKPAGTLVLSGILEPEIAQLLQVYEKYFVVSDIATHEQWGRIVLTRK